jgi:hypothetical protein
MSTSTPDAIVKLLSSHPVAELGDIRQALGGVSRATAFRQLKKVEYRSSYSHNGRYYALHDEKRYDRLGLWSHGDIHFARDSTVVAAATRLVRESEAGRTQRELQDVMGVRVQSFVLAGVRRGDIAREGVEGVYVYFHSDPSLRQAQLGRRREQIETARQAGSEVGDEVVIEVLLQLIRHPGSRAEDVARRLRRRSPPIGIEKVEAVFARYDLGQKGGHSKP